MSLITEPPQLIDQRLLKALSHPTRVHILDVLSEGPSSPSRIAKRIGPHTNVRAVSHHIKVLEGLGCIYLADKIQRGPALEHIYRATERQFFNAEEWEAIEPTGRQPITATILRMIAEDTAKALSTGRFDERSDNHLSRSPLEVDDEGWAELVAILARTLDEVLAVHDKSVDRVSKAGGALMAARVVMMQFLIDRESPYEDEPG